MTNHDSEPDMVEKMLRDAQQFAVAALELQRSGEMELAARMKVAAQEQFMWAGYAALQKKDGG